MAGVMRSEDLPAQVGWHMAYFADPDAYHLTLGPAPREVKSIVNSVDVNDSRFIVGVSGGVSVDAGQVVTRESIKVDDYGLIDAALGSAAPDWSKLRRDAWWWD